MNSQGRGWGGKHDGQEKGQEKTTDYPNKITHDNRTEYMGGKKKQNKKRRTLVNQSLNPRGGRKK